MAAVALVLVAERKRAGTVGLGEALVENAVHLAGVAIAGRVTSGRKFHGGISVLFWQSLFCHSHPALLSLRGALVLQRQCILRVEEVDHLQQVDHPPIDEVPFLDIRGAAQLIFQVLVLAVGDL
jgi:hypothetical protein